MRRLVYLIFILLTLSVTASCIGRPDCVLDEPEMVDVLVDVHRAEGLIEFQRMQGLTPLEMDQFDKEVIAAVLQKHNVTREEYDSSLMWYAKNLKVLTRVYSHVEERLKEENEMWNMQIAESQDFGVSQAGDSVELWTLHHHLVLDRKRYSDICFWELPSDSNFESGDMLHWRFDVRQLLPGQQLIASISLIRPQVDEDTRREIEHSGKNKIRLSDEPVGYARRVIRNTGFYEINVKADSIQPFGKAIIGLVLMQIDTARSNPVFVDSLSLLRTHRP